MFSSLCIECAKRRARERSHRPEVKEARRIYTKRYRELNKERIREEKKKWRNKNKDRIREKKRRQWIDNKEELTSKRLETKYGITLEQYEQILSTQNGGCAICKSTDQKNKRTERFAVDHCHTTGVVRGLLCHSCNRGLGYLGDTLEDLEAAVVYLKGVKS